MRRSAGGEVIVGAVEVSAPARRTASPREHPPGDSTPEARAGERGEWHRRLIAAAAGLAPLRTAVVHPVDRATLLGTAEAARANLIIPVLVGPVERIRAAAAAAAIDLSAWTVVATEHSHAAAARAVALACAGEVEAVMKGSLRTDELMRAAVERGAGLRPARRMSHVFVVDVPTYPRPLFVTDATLNIAPDLDAKRDIVQNAIELACAVGVDPPRVAILSAVETVRSQLHSTVDAAALSKMADRGQILGGIVDGPLAFDNAVSAEAARIKGIASPVTGRADILLVPDLESGNMLVKQLEYLAGAEIAGIVLGVRVPIVLTSRADDALAHASSCALALLQARNPRHESTARGAPMDGNAR